ncbi:hypothetical protein K1T71_012766 [Dendrolimus kikuchii]|uniref:Uncharacterized protein n=1 Tax=Dendrolimus kikuchii TaxID=765133 RepID=A0ACC1CKD0_9NEOP|nr:hypothetical protein K1T71_012766 [Dendrolimus kikuchii]
MFLEIREIVFLFFIVTVLILVLMYLQMCDLIIGRYIFRVFRQKTRNPQQRRLYVGSRARPSLAQQEPTIFVSPSNLPPPPKYECMAPPSYEEVVGVHYPNYQIPITQPITTALAQSSGDAHTSPRNDTPTAPETVVTVANETRRPSTTAVRS